nr:hypothetical protein [Tanacetum cinerariifolium]
MALYTPQQNGVAERKNRTLKEMINSMLSYSGLTEGFWGEAMLTACYILNRSLNKNSKQIPYEIWTKKVSNLTYLRIWGCTAVVRLTESKMKSLCEKGIDCIFIGYADHSKCSRPRGMIQPSSGKIAEDEVEGTDDVPRPSVPRNSIRTRKAKSFGFDFQLYLVEGTRDKTLSQREYCYIIEEDPRTLSEAIASSDVAFLKETVQNQVNKTKEFLSSKFDMKDLRGAEVILGIRIKRGNNDPTVKFRHNKGTLVSQLEYSRAIGCLMYAMISTRPDIALLGYPSIIEGYSDASWINNMEDHSSTSGWVFFFGGGTISWASKKQACITSSTMESEFVALAAAGNEAEWLRNLVYEIPL